MGTYHTHIPLPGTRDSNDDTIQGGLGIFLLASLDQKKTGSATTQKLAATPWRIYREAR